jgi:hypothetical protein
VTVGGSVSIGWLKFVPVFRYVSVCVEVYQLVLNSSPVARCVSVGGRLSTVWLKLFTVVRCECGWKFIYWLVKRYPVVRCEWVEVYLLVD